jgi:hypothetical protein
LGKVEQKGSHQPLAGGSGFTRVYPLLEKVETKRLPSFGGQRFHPSFDYYEVLDQCHLTDVVIHHLCNHISNK